MPCNEMHFTPVTFDPSPGHVPEDAPLTSNNLQHPSSRPNRGWGGRRPGAGAPRGNLNALRHGRNSRYHQQLVALLAQIPEIQDTLAEIGKRRRRQQRRADAGAAALIAGLFQRVGDIVLHPENNHLEDNQELLGLLHSVEAQIRELYET